MLVQLLPAATEWLKLGGDLPPVNFWRRIYKLRTTAGITEWPCDVLRHTAASMMICHYKDAQRTALELGNSADLLFRHYRELVTVQDAERFYKMVPSPDLLVAKNQEACGLETNVDVAVRSSS